MTFYLRDVPEEETLEGSFPEQYYLIQEAQFEGIFHTPYKETDGHWLVWFKPICIFPAHKDPDVAGVTSHKENIPLKTYEASKKYAESYAKKCGRGLIDQTRRGKESRLAQKAQTPHCVPGPAPDASCEG